MLHQKNTTIQHRLTEIVQGLSAANSLPAIMAAVLTLTGCAPGTNSSFFREVPAFTVSWESSGVKASCKRDREPSDFEQILKQVALVKEALPSNKLGLMTMTIQGQAENDQKEEVTYYSPQSIGLAVLKACFVEVKDDKKQAQNE